MRILILVSALFICILPNTFAQTDTLYWEVPFGISQDELRVQLDDKYNCKLNEEMLTESDITYTGCMFYEYKTSHVTFYFRNNELSGAIVAIDDPNDNIYSSLIVKMGISQDDQVATKSYSSVKKQASGNFKSIMMHKIREDSDTPFVGITYSIYYPPKAESTDE